MSAAKDQPPSPVDRLQSFTSEASGYQKAFQGTAKDESPPPEIQVQSLSFWEQVDSFGSEASTLVANPSFQASSMKTPDRTKESPPSTNTSTPMVRENLKRFDSIVKLDEASQEVARYEQAFEGRKSPAPAQVETREVPSALRPDREDPPKADAPPLLDMTGAGDDGLFLVHDTNAPVQDDSAPASSAKDSVISPRSVSSIASMPKDSPSSTATPIRSPSGSAVTRSPSSSISSPGPLSRLNPSSFNDPFVKQKASIRHRGSSLMSGLKTSFSRSLTAKTLIEKERVDFKAKQKEERRLIIFQEEQEWGQLLNDMKAVKRRDRDILIDYNQHQQMDREALFRLERQTRRHVESEEEDHFKAIKHFKSGLKHERKSFEEEERKARLVVDRLEKVDRLEVVKAKERHRDKLSHQKSDFFLDENRDRKIILSLEKDAWAAILKGDRGEIRLMAKQKHDLEREETHLRNDLEKQEHEDFKRFGTYWKRKDRFYPSPTRREASPDEDLTQDPLTGLFLAPLPSKYADLRRQLGDNPTLHYFTQCKKETRLVGTVPILQDRVFFISGTHMFLSHVDGINPITRCVPIEDIGHLVCTRRKSLKDFTIDYRWLAIKVPADCDWFLQIDWAGCVKVLSTLYRHITGKELHVVKDDDFEGVRLSLRIEKPKSRSLNIVLPPNKKVVQSLITHAQTKFQESLDQQTLSALKEKFEALAVDVRSTELTLMRKAYFKLDGWRKEKVILQQRARIQDLERANSELEEKNATKAATDKDPRLSTTIEFLEKENAALKESLRVREEKLGELYERDLARESKLTERHQEAQSMHLPQAEKDEELESLRKTVEALRQQIQEAEKDKLALRNATVEVLSQGMQSSEEAKLAEKDREIQSLHVTVEGLRQQMKGSEEAKLAEKDREIQSLHVKVEGLRQQMKGSEAELVEKDQKIQSLQAIVEAKSAEEDGKVRSWHTTAEASRELIQESEERIKSLQMTVDVLTLEKKRSEEEMAHLKHESQRDQPRSIPVAIHKETSPIDMDAKQNETMQLMKKSKEDLEMKLLEKERSINAMNIQSNAEIKRLQEEMKSMQSHIQTKIHEEEDLRVEIEQLKGRLATALKNEPQELLAIIGQKEEECAMWRNRTLTGIMVEQNAVEAALAEAVDIKTSRTPEGRIRKDSIDPELSPCIAYPAHQKSPELLQYQYHKKSYTLSDHVDSGALVSNMAPSVYLTSPSTPMQPLVPSPSTPRQPLANGNETDLRNRLTKSERGRIALFQQVQALTQQLESSEARYEHLCTSLDEYYTKMYT